MTKDYYKTLGISKSVSTEEIKKIYKQLAKKYHPDISKEPNAEAKFKEVSEAYAVLSDEKKRKQYDTFGAEGFQQRYSQEDIFKNFNFSGFEDLFGGDIFDMFFGGGGRRKSSNRGHDLSTNIEISFEESAFGVTKEIKLKKHVQCKECSGTGAKDGDLFTCTKCSGTGQIRRAVRTPFGIMSTATTCNVCGGHGKSAEELCHSCDGQGRVKEIKSLKIKIPAGVDSGSQLRIPGEGEAGARNSIPGDLYVRIQVQPSEIFERRGNDLYMQLPITFSQAVLGDEIKIPTLEKEEKIKIKPYTQTGMHYRLKGKGITYIDGYGIGDLYVIIQVITPTKLSKEQKALFEKIKKTEEKKSILERIKEFAK